MKKYLFVIFASFAILFAGACKTATPQTVAYQSVGAIAISVATARDAYFAYRDGHPGAVPPALDDKIKALYISYQQASLVAASAEKMALSSGQSPDPTAMAAVNSESTKLLTAISIANPQTK